MPDPVLGAVLDRVPEAVTGLVTISVLTLAPAPHFNRLPAVLSGQK